MKATLHPGARRSERRAIRSRGRNRSVLTNVQDRGWYLTLDLLGVGTVRVVKTKAALAAIYGGA